jgi:hypothetical protein
VVAAIVASVGLLSACQRMVDVQNGTRVVDSQGRVISEDIQTLRVPADKAGAYRVQIITRDATSTPAVAQLYDDAQKALTTGNLKLAQQKLDQVIAIQPDYRKAKVQSDALKKGQKVAPDTTPSKPATSTPKPQTPSQPPAAPSALLDWAPDTLTGFTATKAAVDPLSISREYSPSSGNPAKSLVIVAEQFRTSAAAKTALETNVKQRYTKNASSSTIHGHSVYFGTDGARFAVVGFTDGAVMVALEASPDSGAPTAMKATLEKALAQLP